MRRRRSSAFSAGILAMAMAVAGLFLAKQAQAQTNHYGPGGNDGVECWATPEGSGYRVEYNTRNAPDGDNRYIGLLKIVSTDGNKTYVTGQVQGDGGPYTILPTSWITPSQHYYSGTWANDARSDTLNSDSPANASPTVGIAAPSSGATYTAPAKRNATGNRRASLSKSVFRSDDHTMR